jgi:monoamine oxidase
MSKKEQCKALMLKFFGAASAESVDFMAEEEAVAKCRAKVAAMLGEEKAKEFDNVK